MNDDWDNKVEEIYRNQDEEDKEKIRNLEKSSFNRFINKLIAELRGVFSISFFLSDLDPRIVKIKKEGFEYLAYTGDIIQAAKKTISRIFHLD